MLFERFSIEVFPSKTAEKEVIIKMEIRERGEVFTQTVKWNAELSTETISNVLDRAKFHLMLAILNAVSPVDYTKSKKEKE